MKYVLEVKIYPRQVFKLVIAITQFDLCNTPVTFMILLNYDYRPILGEFVFVEDSSLHKDPRQ